MCVCSVVLSFLNKDSYASSIEQASNHRVAVFISFSLPVVSVFRFLTDTRAST